MNHTRLACLLWRNRCHRYVPSHEFFTLTLKVCRKQNWAPIGRSSNCLTFQLGCSRSMDVAAATLLKFWDKCHVMRIDWNMKMVRDGCRAPCTVSFTVVVIFQPNGGAVFLIWPCAMVCVSYGHWWEKFTLMTYTSVWVTLPSFFMLSESLGQPDREERDGTSMLTLMALCALMLKGLSWRFPRAEKLLAARTWNPHSHSFY